MIQKTYRLWVAGLVTLCSCCGTAEGGDVLFWEYGSVGDT